MLVRALRDDQVWTNWDKDRPWSIRPVPRSPNPTLKGSRLVGKIVKLLSFMFESMNLESCNLKLDSSQFPRY